MGGRLGILSLVVLLVAAGLALTRSMWWPSPEATAPLPPPPPEPVPTPAASAVPPAAVAPDAPTAPPAPGAAEVPTATEAGENTVASRTRLEVLTASMQSKSFRVRTRAVLSLGRMKAPAARKLVEAALKDPHPAVQKAAAEALSPPKPAPTPTPTPVAGGRGGYYVHVGKLSAAGASLSPAVLASARDVLAQRVRALPHVRVAPDAEAAAAAKSVLGREGRAGYHLDVNVTKLEQTPTGGTRAQVSVIVQSYPGRDMRAMLSGAATVQGSAMGDEAARMAVTAAIQSAVKKLPHAFSQFAGR